MLMQKWITGVMGGAIAFFAHAVTAVQGIWIGTDPSLAGPRIYFANHASHGDFILIWTVLPPRMRRQVRPVAGADYWDRGIVRRYVGSQVFNAVLIARNGAASKIDPIGQMAEALDQGDSLILFPEGTRNTTDDVLLPFRTGIYHLASSRPDIDLVPVWIENLNRVLPKGAILPVPLMCRVHFGAPMRLKDQETKADFLHRTRTALLSLSPGSEVKG